MKLSIIVPVFNEASHLEDVIHLLLSSPCPIDRQWIFVDDSSTDNSFEILNRLQPEYGYELHKLPKNSGKGSAIRHGLKFITGDFVMIQDADFEYDPSDVPKLVTPLIENKADVVFGSRFKKSANQVHRTYHYFINRFLTVLSNLFSGIYLTDMETCYKLFRRDLISAMNLSSCRFGIEIELTAYVAKTRARIWELPISYYPRTKLHGKKINWKDGVAALFHLVRFNFQTELSEAYTHLPEQYWPERLRSNAKYTRPQGPSSSCQL